MIADPSAIIAKFQTELAVARVELATVRAKRDQMRVALFALLVDNVQLC